MELRIENDHLVVLYIVNEELKVSNTSLYKRLRYHLELYKLQNIYSIQAYGEIAKNIHMWRDDHDLWGKDKLTTYFKKLLQSCEKNQRNTWKTAMLRALIGNATVIAEVS